MKIHNCKLQSTSLKSAFILISMVFKTGKFFIIVQLLIRVLCGLLPAVTALIWQQVLLKIQIIGAASSFIPLFVTLALIGGISASYYYFTEIADTLLRNRISLRLQKIIHKKASEIPIDHYEDPILIDMLERASNIFCYGDAVGLIMTIFGLIQQMITILSIALVVWQIQPLLALLVLSLLIPGIVKLGVNKKRLNLDLTLSPLRREAGVYLNYLTSRSYMKEIQLMNTNNYFLAKWEAVTNNIYFEERASNLHITWIRILTDFIEHGTTIISYAICVYLVLNRQIDIADFGALIVLINQLLQNSNYLMEHMNGIHGEGLSVQSAIGYFDLTCDNRQIKLPVINKITLNDVSYSYPESNHFAVKMINLSIHRGEILVIVGKNGSGKSTLSKLIMGLLDPTEGEVLADQTIMKACDYSSLYRPYSAVFQDYLHYAMNVRDNSIISDTEHDIDSNKLYSLLENLGISFVDPKSNIKLETELGAEFGGIDLSGGQWQQLAIAR